MTSTAHTTDDGIGQAHVVLDGYSHNRIVGVFASKSAAQTFVDSRDPNRLEIESLEIW